jgi:uncharacterized membrane protein YraQ (UPF0718 family)
MTCPASPWAFASSFWTLTAEMAPYLLLGFLLAGCLRAVFTEKWVQQHLGQKGLGQIFKAVVIGIPLPLCSCGVIPVAAGLKRSGGQRGAVAAFTASTPQTGVDSIAATIGLLGLPFTLVRVFIAFVNGVIAGLVVERWGDESATGEAKAKPESACCCESGEPTTPEASAESPSACCATEEATSCCQSEATQNEKQPLFAKLIQGMRFGLITLPGDLSGPLLFGLFLAAAIGLLAPSDLFATLPGGLWTAYLAMTLVSLPLYVCSTGSIPMALSFLAAGASPGAALIFLIAGPASNAATVTSLWRIIGGRGTVGYIISIIATSWLFAAILDSSGIGLLVSDSIHLHPSGPNGFQHACAALLLILLALPWLKKLGNRQGS